MASSAGKDQGGRSSTVGLGEVGGFNRFDTRPDLGSRESRHAASLDERRSDLLLAAEEAFTRRGFSATTMDEIAGAVGMSKKTVYKLFASKNDLFRAMIQSRALEERNEAAPDISESAVEKLKFWLRRFDRIVFSPKEIALQRLIVREAMVAPDLAEIFADIIINPGPRGLIESVRGLRLRPPLCFRSPREVAEMFIGVVYGSTHFKLIISDAYRPVQDAIEERIDLAVELFCDES